MVLGERLMRSIDKEHILNGIVRFLRHAHLPLYWGDDIMENGLCQLTINNLNIRLTEATVGQTHCPQSKKGRLIPAPEHQVQYSCRSS
jgi:hypothetical protein